MNEIEHGGIAGQNVLSPELLGDTHHLVEPVAVELDLRDKELTLMAEDQAAEVTGVDAGNAHLPLRLEFVLLR